MVTVGASAIRDLTSARAAFGVISPLALVRTRVLEFGTWANHNEMCMGNPELAAKDSVTNNCARTDGFERVKRSGEACKCDVPLQADGRSCTKVVCVCLPKALTMSSPSSKPTSSEDIISQKVCGLSVFVFTEF